MPLLNRGVSTEPPTPMFDQGVSTEAQPPTAMLDQGVSTEAPTPLLDQGVGTEEAQPPTATPLAEQEKNPNRVLKAKTTLTLDLSPKAGQPATPMRQTSPKSSERTPKGRGGRGVLPPQKEAVVRPSLRTMASIRVDCRPLGG